MTQRDIKAIEIRDFDYDLPDERIAKFPLKERDTSKLLVYKQGDIQTKQFKELRDYLPTGTVLVRNNSRVIHARLLFQKPTGARVEIFCLEPIEPNSYELALSARESSSWNCMLGNARRWHSEQILERRMEGKEGCVRLSAQRLGANEVRFFWDNPAYSFGELLELMGILPIPPYLNRDTEDSDKTTYQTVYARQEGSVAAPTAGLHFTPKVFERLEQKGIKALDVTLHVGAGTFKPVKSEQIGEHSMHRELIELKRSTIETIKDSLGSIVAVGTTSVRTLESLYWLGLMIKENLLNDADITVVPQWFAYETKTELSADESLELILDYMEREGLEDLVFSTAIMIVPSYQFRIVRAMLTNFHQPHSTLLLLISAFIGEDWHKVYDYALANDYRFLSYGDSSLLMP